MERLPANFPLARDDDVDRVLFPRGTRHCARHRQSFRSEICGLCQQLASASERNSLRPAFARLQPRYVHCLLDMNLPAAPVIEQPVRHIRKLLHLAQRQARADRMDRARRNQKRIARAAPEPS